MGRAPNPAARDALIAAARVEFGKAGLDRARVEDITRRAGLSKGAFYLHFESKEAVFEVIVQRIVGAMDDLFARMDEGEKVLSAKLGYLTGEDCARRNERFLAWDAFWSECNLSFLETLWRNREVLAVIESSGASGRWRAMVSAFRMRVSQHMVGSLARAQMSGGLRSGLLPEAVTDLAVGAYDSFLRRMTTLKAKPDFRAWSATVNEVLHNGFLPAAAPAKSIRRHRRSVR